MLPLRDSSGLHPARVCGRRLHPPGAPAKDQALQTGMGAPQLGPVFLSARLFCSSSACPPPPRDTGGQELGSLGPSLFPAPALDTQAGPLPRSRDGLSQGQPSASGSEEALGKRAEPVLPQGPETGRQGWGCHRAHQQGERGRGGRDRTAPHPGPGPRSGNRLSDETCSSVRPETRWARAAPRVTDLRKEGRGGPRPCSRSWSHRQGLAPVMSSGSVSSPLPPPQPSEPPSPT